MFSGRHINSMDTLVDRFARAFQEHSLLSRSEPVLLAVSGGLDSMVMLELFMRLASAHPRRMVVAHFNHRLRGGDSMADQQLVRQRVKAAGLEFKQGRGNVSAYAARQGLSIEMAARELRHRFLAETAESLGIAKVALAHHLDDQVELFFLRLFRGAGPDGLSGMKWINPSPFAGRIRLIRPLLGLRREDLEIFAREQKVPFRVDTTNSTLNYQRNRIRNELLPLLYREYHPALRETVLRLQEILVSESQVVQEAAATALRAGVPFQKWSIALQRRSLREQCLELGIEPDFALVELLRTGRNPDCMIEPGRAVHRDDAGRVHVRATDKAVFRRRQCSVNLSMASGRVTFGTATVQWQIGTEPLSPAALRHPAKGCERFDADKVGKAVRLRHWQPGDRFQPIGMPNAVKLQDLFTNLKVPQGQRRKLLLGITRRNEIFWVEGLRISERFKIDDQTVRYLEWRWSRPGGL